MWPFRKQTEHRTLGARVYQHQGRTVVNVEGQTCPGYLLSINRAVDPLPKGTPVTITTSYAPCGADVEAWCREKGFTYETTSITGGKWSVQLTT
jgi:TusA-related sulfurtransferase